MNPTRGTRTHLIIPQVRTGTPPPDSQRDLGGGGGGGGGGGNDEGGGGATTPRPYDDLRAAYVSTLIDALREKSKSGEVDIKLMARIEKLLAIQSTVPRRGQHRKGELGLPASLG